jgi:NAD(P)-dependent dehydrogenase (short-subunit alcohol dehydrogenase family)
MKLEEKVAIVTGGSQGIGEAICHTFAQEGAKVAVVNHRRPELGQDVAKKIVDGGGAAKAFRCNISKKNECQSLVKEVTGTFGTVDILVNSAGIMINRPFEDYTEEEWDETMNVNLKGSFLMSQAVVPLMKKKRYGKIIFVASIGGTHAFANVAAYCASKGGVIMVAKALAVEVAKFGINVNCISPGNTATPLNKHLQDDPEFVKFLTTYTPTGRAYMTVGDLTGAAVFLASDDCKAVHGLNLIVDDGWSLM